MRWGRATPTGLRARLILAVGAVVIVTVAVAFAAVYRQTGAELNSQLNRSIHASAIALAQAATQGPHARAEQVLTQARRYARSQPYRNAAVLLFAIVPGVGTATNHRELFGDGGRDPDGDGGGESRAEQAQENAEGHRLASPHPGFETEPAPDVGLLRIDQQRVELTGGRFLYAGAGESLENIERDQHGVLGSFALGGGLALLLALGFAFLTGTRMSGPLRRVSQVAAQIDGGDLTPRIELPPGTNRELRVLTQAFNHMLDRLAGTFDAQREFLADAAHELRTPLTVIRGQLELLAGASAVQRDDVRAVERLIQFEISRLTRLTDDLLLLTRADHDDFLRRETFELAPFITQIWDGLSLTARRRFEVGPQFNALVWADPDRLAQALRNLGANAIAHTDEPDGLVRITAMAAPHHRDRVLICVQDDGPGVPESHREQIFARFHRIDPGRDRRQGGAGLGLAIVRAITEAHGGTVRVGESAIPGARFEMELPSVQTGSAHPQSAQTQSADTSYTSTPSA